MPLNVFNMFYLELFLKEKHSVIGFYIDQRQTEELFRMMEKVLNSKSYILNVTRELGEL